MLTKNIGELRTRAHFHQTHSNTSGGYGSAKIDRNGVVRYRGCAVGCLSTPASNLEDWLREKAREFDVNLDGAGIALPAAHERLTQEFGLTQNLLDLIEGLFMAVREKGGLDDAQFIVDVAEAIPDGVNIAPQHCRSFLKRWEAYQTNEVYEAVPNPTWPTIEQVADEEGAGIAAERFLAWLRTFAPERSAVSVPVQA